MPPAECALTGVHECSLIAHSDVSVVRLPLPPKLLLLALVAATVVVDGPPHASQRARLSATKGCEVRQSRYTSRLVVTAAGAGGAGECADDAGSDMTRTSRTPAVCGTRWRVGWYVVVSRVQHTSTPSTSVDRQPCGE